MPGLTQYSAILSGTKPTKSSQLARRTKLTKRRLLLKSASGDIYKLPDHTAHKSRFISEPPLAADNHLNSLAFVKGSDFNPAQKYDYNILNN